MEKGKDRVAVRHSRACVPHRYLNFLQHGRFITVHRAIGTCRLVLLKGTLIEAQFCVIEEFPAVRTELARGSIIAVMVTAIDLDHGMDRSAFSRHPWVSLFHRRCLLPRPLNLSYAFMLTNRMPDAAATNHDLDQVRESFLSLSASSGAVKERFPMLRVLFSIPASNKKFAILFIVSPLSVFWTCFWACVIESGIKRHGTPKSLRSDLRAWHSEGQ